MCYFYYYYTKYVMEGDAIPPLSKSLFRMDCSIRQAFYVQI